MSDASNISRRPPKNSTIIGGKGSTFPRDVTSIDSAPPIFLPMKDRYYFPHDYHARNDPKLEKLRIVLGCEGVGIYWCLIEMLYEENGYLLLNDIPIYARSLYTDESVLRKVVNEYDLFVKKGNKFTSKSLMTRLKHINAKRSKARASARTRWDANAMRTQCDGNARKGKESKVNIYSEDRADLVSLRSLVDRYFVLKDVRNKELIRVEYPRFSKVAKKMLAIGGGSDGAMAVLNKAPRYFKDKGLDWTMETVIKRWTEISDGGKTKVTYE